MASEKMNPWLEKKTMKRVNGCGGGEGGAGQAGGDLLTIQS